MNIDCHGHSTTAPEPLEDWRRRQVASLKDAALEPGALNSAASKDAAARDWDAGVAPAAR